MLKVFKTTLVEQYKAPVCEIQYLQSEGIICASGDGSIEDWEDDGDPITI